ncbi:MAG: hypothetical protein ACE5J7_03850 [Candidatus Aenigmatarchaeota archaeon]
MEQFYLNFCERLHMFPGARTKIGASQELKESVDFLGWKIRPDKIVYAARAAMITSALFFLVLVALSVAFGANPAIFIIAAVVFPLLLNQLISEYPKTLAKQRALTALGTAPQLVAQLAVNLKQNPNLEKAMEFVAEHGEGELAQDFRKVLWKVWTGKVKSAAHALPAIAEKWGKWSEGFHRAIYLIISSQHERNPKRRAFSLDRAVETVLDDILTKMREYSFGLHIPTLIMFSFGIIMPLILISLFPLLGFFGIPLSLEAITLFLLASLIAVYIYSNNVLGKRPVTFPMPDVKTRVPRGYINLYGRILPTVPFCLAVALLIAFPSIFYLLSLTNVIVITGAFGSFVNFVNTMPLIWGVGVAAVLYTYGSSWFKKKERERIVKLNSQIPDALYHIRSILSDSRPMEEALDFSSRALGKSELGKKLRETVNIIKRRHITFEKAVMGKEGIAHLSKAMNTAFSLLTASMKRGIKSASQTCDVIYKYLSRIRKIEKSMTMMLERNLAMMRMTAILFAPLVCAIIVVLFQLILEGVTGAFERFQIMGYMPLAPISAPAIPTPVLQLILGLYALGLNFVLIRYVSMVRWGKDDVALNLEIAKSMGIVLLLFTTALIGLWTILI